MGGISDGYVYRNCCSISVCLISGVAGMGYTTITFMIFILLVTTAYYMFPVKKYQWTVLLAASYVFYLWASWKYAVFLLFTTFTVYFAALIMYKNSRIAKETIVLHNGEWNREQKKQYKEEMKKKRKKVLIMVLVLNFGILIFLKYFNLFAGGMNRFLGKAGMTGSVPGLHLVLPLGISFYTFQSAGYLIDVYREKTEPERNPAKYALFVSFFSQIIQGPISFYDQLSHQLYAERKFSYRNLKHGALLMLCGYLKKMVIADRAVSLIQMVAPDYTQYNGTVIFITVLVYALQLYADFSGGIDISRGFAEILGIEMAENFRRPYFAVSINDYWRRWHITLGAWMKSYVFYSLAMSKRFFKMGKNLKQKYGDHAIGAHVAKVLPAGIASFITFLLVGIWHGANMKYVAFGVWNGGVILLSVLMQPLFNKAIAGLHIQPQKKSWHIFQILRTFLIVLVGYMFDIGNNFSAAMDMLGRCIMDFSFDISQITEQITSCGMTLYDYMLLILMTVLIFYVSLIQERHPDTTIRKLLEEKYPKFQWIVLFAGLLCIAIFGMYGPGCNAADFVYMQF